MADLRVLSDNLPHLFNHVPPPFNHVPPFVIIVSLHDASYLRLIEFPMFFSLLLICSFSLKFFSVSAIPPLHLGQTTHELILTLIEILLCLCSLKLQTT
jgi:hypothetical protein